MNQAVGVDQFDRQGRRHRIVLPGEEVLRPKRQNGPQALAPGIHAVADRLMQSGGMNLASRKGWSIARFT